MIPPRCRISAFLFIEGSFYPYEALLHTMLHELVHMEIGPHSAKFYKMLDELRDECEKLMRNGEGSLSILT